MLESNVADDTSSNPKQSSGAPYRRGSLARQKRLVFTRGASRVTLEAMPFDGETIDADFEGHDARLTETPSEVRIGYVGSWWSWAYDALLGGPTELPHSTLRLSDEHLWSVECRGGVSDLDAHLEDLPVASFLVRGGASNVYLSLGRPSGVVPIRIRGGVSRLELLRPLGVGVRLSVRGGIGRLTFDAMTLEAVGGGLDLASRTGAEDADRYEIEIGGGVSDLTIA